jgi:hypothetical protein
MLMPSKKSTTGTVGAWSFIVGGLVAIILGAIPSIAGAWVIGLLLVLGLIVGLLNITDHEVLPFLIACVAFLVAAPTFGVALGGVVSGFDWLIRILNNLAVFVLPAAVVASIKAIFALASAR